MNGLSYAIEDEFNVLNFRSMVEAYLAAMRIEEKLFKKQQNVRRALDMDEGRKKKSKWKKVKTIPVQQRRLLEKDLMLIEDVVEQQEVEVEEVNLKSFASYVE